MKFIPLDQLIVILQSGEKKMIDIRYLEYIFNLFGDDYYINRDTAEYELSLENEARKHFIRRIGDDKVTNT